MTATLGVHDYAAEDVRRLTAYVVGDQQNLVYTWDAVTTWFTYNVPPRLSSVYICPSIPLHHHPRVTTSSRAQTAPANESSGPLALTN